MRLSGIPAEAMLIGSLDTTNSGGYSDHAILVVRTDLDLLVLDNRTDEIKRTDDTSYNWLHLLI